MLLKTQDQILQKILYLSFKRRKLHHQISPSDCETNTTRKSENEKGGGEECFSRNRGGKKSFPLKTELA